MRNAGALAQAMPDTTAPNGRKPAAGGDEQPARRRVTFDAACAAAERLGGSRTRSWRASSAAG
jgi:hypothetical protein